MFSNTFATVGESRRKFAAENRVKEGIGQESNGAANQEKQMQDLAFGFVHKKSGNEIRDECQPFTVLYVESI